MPQALGLAAPSRSHLWLPWTSGRPEQQFAGGERASHELRQLMQWAQERAGTMTQPSASDFADAVSATDWWCWDMLALGSEERVDASAGDATVAAGAEQGNGDKDAAGSTGRVTSLPP